MGKGMGGHQSTRMISDEWLTPPEIIHSLGIFDLDPCGAINAFYSTALTTFTVVDDGLSKDWFGRVWLNPPYGSNTKTWLSKLANHGNGIALIFARTETKMFIDHVWNKANSLFFLYGRLNFYHVNGIKGNINSGAPSVLVAYGKNNTKTLKECGLYGKHIILTE